MELKSPILIDWLSSTIELLRLGCTMGMLAYIAMRFKPVRRALSGAHTLWKYQIATVLFFGVLAILGTHIGFILDTSTGQWSRTTLMGRTLNAHEAIIGVRDLIILAAGIFGGVWVGLGAGLLAGFERWYLGGSAADISALATLAQGVGAGLCRTFWPSWTISIKGILTVSAMGTVVQKSMLLLSQIMVSQIMDEPTNGTASLVWQTTLPVLVANSLGCLLFLWVMKDLEQDQNKIREQNIRLSALHAQVEPHFLNNMLTVAQSLVDKNPALAFDFLSKMAMFFNKTRISASSNSITLSQELSHLKLYLELQSQRFPEEFNFHENIPNSLLQCHIAPRSLQTLVENIFIHARHGTVAPIQISITGQDLNDTMQIRVIDTGRGMTQERANILGTQEVLSKRGSGSALYQINCTLALVFNGNASLEVESQKGTGTTIILHMPKRHEAW